MTWNHLPAQIKFSVLGYLAEVEYCNGASLVNYTRISRQWQPVFEQFTFRSAQVKACDLHKFRTIFQGARRKYLKHLDFIVELPRHGGMRSGALQGSTEQIDLGYMVALAVHSPVFGKQHRFPELRDQMKENNMVFTNTLFDLLTQLSTWCRNEIHQDGISLEIISNSESYWQEMAKRQRGCPDSMTMYPPRLNNKDTKLVKLVWHRWEKVLEAATHDFGLPLELDFTGTTSRSANALPKVEVVTKLSVSRKTTRIIHPDTMAMILRRIPSVVRFDWEIWPRLPHKFEKDFRKNVSATLCFWPQSLREVCIHQVEHFRIGGSKTIMYSPHLTSLALRLALLSQNLEHFSVSYCIDAKGFFSDNTLQWPNLKRLTLRSQPLIVEQSSTSDHLLEVVASAALRMPQLNSLALYHSSNGLAGIFSYAIGAYGTMAGVRCNWQFRLDRNCQEAWEIAAKRHGSDVAEWKVEELPLEVILFRIRGRLRRDLL